MKAKCAQKPEQVIVRVGDDITGFITRDEARALRDTEQWYFADSGREIRKRGVVREYKHKETMLTRAILPGFSLTALNRGRVGQFTIGYPIPPAYKGHLTEPVAKLINAEA